MTPLKISRPLFYSAALFTAAGAYVHLHEWLRGYRRIPSSIPGSWVVRLGFPISALAAAVAAVSIMMVAVRIPKLIVPALTVNTALQVGMLSTLIATRVGSVFGWSERVWTPGANQARAVEIGAIAMSTLAIATYRYLANTVRLDTELPKAPPAPSRLATAA